MAIEFDCPNCRTRIRTPDEAAGKKARCPNCEQISPVPYSSPLPSLNPFGDAGSSPPQADHSAPWLPPADAFAPQGPQHFSGPHQAPYPNPHAPPSANPFGEQLSPQHTPLNPYQSPSQYAALDATPLTPEQVRAKLLGPAIGMTLGAAVCIGVIAFFAVLVWFDDDFHADLQGADQAETIGGYVAFAFFVGMAILPSMFSLLGPWAMFRGRGVVSAWLGTIAGLLPCNPCFFITAGFAIWGMVVLSDPRVQKGMQG